MRIVPIRRATAAIALSLALAACQQGASEPQGKQDASAAAGPEAKPGISLDNGSLILPVIAGRPAAVYFTLSNKGDKAVELAGVHVDGAASAEMHEMADGKMSRLEKLTLAAGETVTFAPGGKHVMAFDLADTVTAGSNAEMTLTFADGDKISAPLAVKPRAEAGHEGMDHGGEH